MEKKTTTNTKKKNNTRTERSRSKGKFILLGLGVVAIASAGIGFYYLTRPKKSKDLTFDNPTSTPSNNPIVLPVKTGGGSSSGFPLKRGSRGQLVKNLQEALINKYGTSILPRFGADGHWGSEMQTALIAKGLPTTISADDFTNIVTSNVSTGSGSDSPDPPKKKRKFRPALVASNLRIAILDNDFSKALRSMSILKSVKGYSAVNTEFKKKRIGGVRKTVVNGLLTAFRGASQKKKLNAHFHRIGLKYNGRQWSLSGPKVGGLLNGALLQTINDTSVWSPSGLKMNITKDTILGEFIEANKGVTRFRTAHNEELLIHTKHISYV